MPSNCHQNQCQQTWFHQTPCHQIQHHQTWVFAISESLATSLHSPAPTPMQPTIVPPSMALLMMLPPIMVLPGATNDGTAYYGATYYDSAYNFPAYNGVAYDGTTANDGTTDNGLPYDVASNDGTVFDDCTFKKVHLLLLPQPTLHHEETLIKWGSFLRRHKK